MQQERHRPHHSKLANVVHAGWEATLTAMLLVCSSLAFASDQLVVELNRQLASESADAVNAVLSANWETKSARLGKLTERCEPDALKLSVALLATTNLEALAEHHYSLQVAMGRCPQLLLPITPDERVLELCSVSAYIEANPKGDSIRELSRRRAKLHKLGQLEETTKGQKCAQAYERQGRELAK